MMKTVYIGVKVEQGVAAWGAAWAGGSDSGILTGYKYLPSKKKIREEAIRIITSQPPLKLYARGRTKEPFEHITVHTTNWAWELEHEKMLEGKLQAQADALASRAVHNALNLDI